MKNNCHPYNRVERLADVIAGSDVEAANRALVPMALLSFIFTVAGIVLLNQPMGMRHGM